MRLLFKLQSDGVTNKSKILLLFLKYTYEEALLVTSVLFVMQITSPSLARLFFRHQTVLLPQLL